MYAQPLLMFSYKGGLKPNVASSLCLSLKAQPTTCSSDFAVVIKQQLETRNGMAAQLCFDPCLVSSRDLLAK